MFTHPSRSRHQRRVIDQEGRALEDTVRFPRLRFALWGQVDARDLYAAPEGERTVPLPVVAGPSRVLPVHGHGTIALRVPAAPKPAAHPHSFFDDTAFVAHITQVQVGANAIARRMAGEFDQHMQGLLRHARELAAQWRYAAAEGDGIDLAAAYAEGGTEKLLRLTPQVLAAMDARAKAAAGSVVAA